MEGFAWRFCLCVMQAGIAGSWEEALICPADVAIWLIHEATMAAIAANERQEPKKPDRETTMIPGGRTVRFNSVEGLAAELASIPGSGVRIGR